MRLYWHREGLLFLSLAVLCFASSGWGMARHFQRAGKPTRAMMLTALLAMISAALQITALARMPIVLPYLAAALYAASLAIFWWAVSVTRGKLAACGQGLITNHIVTEGPYRFVRHPFYLSYNLAWTAGFVATFWWPLAASSIAMGLLYEHFAQEEERGFMAGPLAGKYRVYARNAGRYLPRIAMRQPVCGTRSDPRDRSA